MGFVAKYVVLFNLTLFVGVTYILADLASLFVGQKLEVHPSLPPLESLAKSPAAVRPPQELYRAILDRNIFNLEPVSSIPEPEPFTPIELPPLRLKLVGTVVGDSSSSFAMIQDIATKEEHLYRLGDPIGEDGKVAEINRSRVVILRLNQVRETIEVNWNQTKEKKKPVRSRRNRKAKKEVKASPPGKTSWVIDRQEVEEKLGNLPKFLPSLFVGQKLEVHPSLPPLESLAKSPAAVRPPQELYRAILDRNIFNLEPVSSIPEPEPFTPIELPPLRLKLVGTVVGDSSSSFAMIQDIATKEEHLYRLGDPIGEDGKVAEINRSRVVILRLNQVRETIEVNWNQTKEKKKPVRSRRNRKAKKEVKASPPGKTSWVIDRQEVEEKLGNLPKLLTQARVIPHLSADGRSEGFRIVSIKPDSFYQRVGLKNGDIIQRINGVEIKDPATFMSVFSQLKNENNVSLDLIRGNKKETFSYEIR